MRAYLPTISGYGRYASDNYGANCLRVDVGPLTLWYSYKTVIAFRGPGYRQTVSENAWGPTTGRHLNWIDGGDAEAKKARLPREAFEAKLRELLTSLGLSDEL